MSNLPTVCPNCGTKNEGKWVYLCPKCWCNFCKWTEKKGCNNDILIYPEKYLQEYMAIQKVKVDFT